MCNKMISTNYRSERIQIISDRQKSEVLNAPYRALIGSLMYLANRTRPDILFAVNFLAKFIELPLEKHWQAANKLSVKILSCNQELFNNLSKK